MLIALKTISRAHTFYKLSTLGNLIKKVFSLPEICKDHW